MKLVFKVSVRDGTHRISRDFRDKFEALAFARQEAKRIGDLGGQGSVSVLGLAANPPYIAMWDSENGWKSNTGYPPVKS